MLGPDAENESPAGAHLAAAVIYPTLYDRSPEGLPSHHWAFSTDDAAYLQRVAWETVEAWRQRESQPISHGVTMPPRPLPPTTTTGSTPAGPSGTAAAGSVAGSP